eukprot:15199-Heterococcus_DN1.PRE.2
MRTCFASQLTHCCCLSLLCLRGSLVELSSDATAVFVNDCEILKCEDDSATALQAAIALETEHTVSLMTASSGSNSSGRFKKLIIECAHVSRTNSVNLGTRRRCEAVSCAQLRSNTMSLCENCLPMLLLFNVELPERVYTLCSLLYE